MSKMLALKNLILIIKISKFKIIFNNNDNAL